MNHTVIDSNVFPAGSATLEDIVKELYIINFNIVASAALLSWDILLTFNREVEYIWKSKFSLVTVLFGGVRLLAVGGDIILITLLVGTLSVNGSFCKGLIWFEAILGLIMVTCVDILLISRVYALYRKSKVLLVSLCALEAIAFVAVVSVYAMVLPEYQGGSNPFPHQLHVGSCMPLGFPHLEPDIWIPMLVVQTVLFTLAIGQFIYLRCRGTGPTLFNTVYYTFIRDGSWTFCVLFAILLLCVIGTRLHLGLGIIAIYWGYPVTGICVSRLIINLRSNASINQGLEMTPFVISEQREERYLNLEM